MALTLALAAAEKQTVLREFESSSGELSSQVRDLGTKLTEQRAYLSAEVTRLQADKEEAVAALEKQVEQLFVERNKARDGARAAVERAVAAANALANTEEQTKLELAAAQRESELKLERATKQHSADLLEAVKQSEAYARSA
eukprot:4731736-Pleurochrysis_carterae.AAC.1